MTGEMKLSFTGWAVLGNLREARDRTAWLVVVQMKVSRSHFRLGMCGIRRDSGRTDVRMWEPGVADSHGCPSRET